MGYYAPMRHDGPPLLRSVAVVFGIILTISCLGTLDLETGRINVMSSIPTRFYGMDFKGLNWQIPEFSWEREATYDIMRDYGVNMIRRHFSGEPCYNNDSAYMAKLERCATLAAARGMWVIFDLYSWGVGTDYSTVRFTAARQWDKTSPYWTDARWNQLWTNLGNRFKQHPNVIFELMNEPDEYTGSVSGNAMYDATAARCAATVTLLRNLGFTNYIGIPPLEFGSTLSPWVTRYTTIDAADPLDKFLFFIHYYNYWHGGGTSESQIRTYLTAHGADAIQDLGYRVCIGEFGVHGDENEQSSTERTWFQNFLKVQRDDGYDTCFQSFQPADFPAIQSRYSDTYWPTRTPTTVFRYFYQGFTGYGGIPDGLEYYTLRPYDDGTLTVLAQYTTGTPIAADAQVWTQGTGSTAYVGVSSYPRTDAGAYSTAVIDTIIDTMDDAGLSIYRMSVYYTQSTTVFAQMAQHFLDHCAYDLILCRHVYDPGGAMPSWSDARQWTLDMAAQFSDYPDRLWLEPENEVGSASLAAEMQTLITAVRNAGYTHRIVANKWNQNWSDFAAITDPQDRFYTGYHYYFNSWSVSGATAQMTAAIAAGIAADHLINTEIGADYNEASAFSDSEVAEVNSFMAWCANQAIGNCVWQRYNLQNWDTYQSMNLTFPVTATRQLVASGTTPLIEIAVDVGVYDLAVRFNNVTQTRVVNVFSHQPTVESFTFQGSTPPTSADDYTVNLVSATGGYTIPGSGSYVLLVSQAFTALAYAAADYVFTKWLRDGNDYTTNTQITFTGYDGVTYTVQPVFTLTPGEPAEAEPPWRLPNPYEPEVEATPPASTTAPPAPASLVPPDAPIVVGDSVLFDRVVRHVQRMHPPTLEALLHHLSRLQAPTFRELRRRLERGGSAA